MYGIVVRFGAGSTGGYIEVVLGKCVFYIRPKTLFFAYIFFHFCSMHLTRSHDRRLGDKHWNLLCHFLIFEPGAQSLATRPQLLTLSSLTFSLRGLLTSQLLY